MRKLWIAAPLVLAACGGQTPQVQRDATSVAQDVVAARFPAAPPRETARCIVNNASQEELAILQANQDAMTDQIAASTVNDILARPSTNSCLAANGVSLLNL